MRFDLVVATPSTGNCKAQFAFSLANLVMHYNQVPVYPEVSEQAISFLLQEGTGVGANREKMVSDFLASEATHLLFIDDDMGFNPEVLHILASRRQEIVGCNYRLKAPPARFMANRGGKVIKTTQESRGLEEVDLLGFGFCLLTRKALESVPTPKFLGSYIGGTYTTEDWAFFSKTPFKKYIDHDASKLIWHIGNMNYFWNDDYSELNKDFRPYSASNK